MSAPHAETHGFRLKDRTPDGRLVVECRCGERFADPFGSEAWRKYEEHVSQTDAVA